MAAEYRITDPRSFRYSDGQKDWLGVDIRDCQFYMYDIVWIKSPRPRIGGDFIRQPPPDFHMDNSLRVTLTEARRCILLPPSSDPELSNSDHYATWLGLDVSNIDQTTQRALGAVQFLLIPCSALEAQRVPGFEGGCVP